MKTLFKLFWFPVAAGIVISIIASVVFNVNEWQYWVSIMSCSFAINSLFPTVFEQTPKSVIAEMAKTIREKQHE